MFTPESFETTGPAPYATTQGKGGLFSGGRGPIGGKPRKLPRVVAKGLFVAKDPMGPDGFAAQIVIYPINQ